MWTRLEGSQYLLCTRWQRTFQTCGENWKWTVRGMRTHTFLKKRNHILNKWLPNLFYSYYKLLHVVHKVCISWLLNAQNRHQGRVLPLLLPQTAPPIACWLFPAVNYWCVWTKLAKPCPKDWVAFHLNMGHAAEHKLQEWLMTSGALNQIPYKTEMSSTILYVASWTLIKYLRS